MSGNVEDKIYLSFPPSAKAIVITLLSRDYVATQSYGFHVPYGIKHMLLCYAVQVSL